MLNWKNPGRAERRMMETLNIIFTGHPKLLNFLFHEESASLRAEPSLLLTAMGGYSGGEKILIRIALDLWNGSGNVNLWHIIGSLDDDTFVDALLGLLHLRKIDPCEAPISWRCPSDLLQTDPLGGEF